MRSIFGAVGLVLGLSACAAPQPNATDNEKKSAMEAWVKCQYEEAFKLDDHHSDVSSVAVAVAGACAGEYGMVVETETRGMNIDMQLRFRRIQMEQGAELKSATMGVLIERKNTQ